MHDCIKSLTHIILMLCIHTFHLQIHIHRNKPTVLKIWFFHYIQELFINSALLGKLLIPYQMYTNFRIIIISRAKGSKCCQTQESSIAWLSFLYLFHYTFKAVTKYFLVLQKYGLNSHSKGSAVT